MQALIKEEEQSNIGFQMGKTVRAIGFETYRQTNKSNAGKLTKIKRSRNVKIPTKNQSLMIKPQTILT